jgi:uncharacterized membrane protein
MRGLTPGRGALGALIAAQVVHGRRSAPPPPASTRRMLAAMLATSAIEAVEAQGPRRGFGALTAAGLTGFGAELIGVATDRPFGAYRYSAQLGPRVGGVPVLAAAAWAIMARPAWIAAGWIAPGRWGRVPLAAAALAGWDVYLDPRMAQEGYWTWERPGRYAGIPASNFAGWFLTGCAVFSLLAVVDSAPPGPRDDGALALYVWTWLGEAVANGVLWRRRGVAAAGAAAMGAVAVPAVRARRQR